MNKRKSSGALRAQNPGRPDGTWKHERSTHESMVSYGTLLREATWKRWEPVKRCNRKSTKAILAALSLQLLQHCSVAGPGLELEWVWEPGRCFLWPSQPLLGHTGTGRRGIHKMGNDCMSREEKDCIFLVLLIYFQNMALCLVRQVFINIYLKD